MNLLLTLLLAATPTPRLARPELEAWLDGYFTRALAEARLAGAVVVVVQDGTVLVERGFGYADVAGKRPIDPERTLFRLGSISKLVTGAAVMQLVETGKLDLDRDLNGYLDFRIPDRFGRPITLRNLLTHTAGFEDVLKQLIVVDSSEAEPLRVYLERNLPARIYPPGTTPAYSNYGLALAGYLVERVSGEPFEQYVERHLFAPLGMARSTFRQPLPGRLAGDMALGYRDPAKVPEPFSIYGPGPAGALSSTGADIARFMIALLSEGRLGETSILQPETVRRMEARAFGPWPELNGMGLTFWHLDRNGHRIVGHDGGDPTFRSNLRLFPDEGVGFFVSFNAIGPDGGVFPVRSVLIDQFIDRYFPGSAPVAPALEATSTGAAHARIAVGRYQAADQKAGFFRVLGLLDQTDLQANEDGTIVISSVRDLSGKPKVWQEIGPFIWGEIGGQDRLAMTVADGEVRRIARGSDPAGTLLRVPWWRSSRNLVVGMLAGALVLLAGLIRWPIRCGVAGRATRLVGLIDLTVLVGWLLLFFGFAAGDLALLSPPVAPFTSVLRGLGLLGGSGTVLAGWTFLLVVRSEARRPVKAWSGFHFLACAMFAWFGLVSQLFP